MAGQGADDKIAFDYIKSAQFRVIHADGAIGSVTPSGLVHFALYSERPAIPRRLVHQLSADGDLGDKLDQETETRDSIVREMDVDVMMTPLAAKALATWLLNKVAHLEKEAAAEKISKGDEK